MSSKTPDPGFCGNGKWKISFLVLSRCVKSVRSHGVGRNTNTVLCEALPNAADEGRAAMHRICAPR